jgi:carbonic anhydrase/acetyltransferase-like protein (isoleucine patch superfamily)
MILSFENQTPRLAEGVFVAQDAIVLGDVTLGRDSSVWFGAVVRGDIHSISVGERTNIQDRSVLHVTGGEHPAQLGDDVTVGHAAVIHGCRIGSRCLVGIGAIVLDGVEVGEGSVIGAGSLLPPGKIYPPRSLVMGCPGSARREVTEAELKWIVQSAQNYVALARRHAAMAAVADP